MEPLQETSKKLPTTVGSNVLIKAVQTPIDDVYDPEMGNLSEGLCDTAFYIEAIGDVVSDEVKETLLPGTEVIVNYRPNINPTLKGFYKERADGSSTFWFFCQPHDILAIFN